jgi:dTDP-4-dehydrorhamnose 3,5-epimerase
MTLTQSKLDGVFEIEQRCFEDERGLFVKPYSSNQLEKLGLDPVCEESFYSVSKQGVIRGMHFQTPPHDMAKLITVTHGAILDVVVDLRRNSATYGQSVSFELDATQRNAVYVPTGCAHGFLSLTENSVVLYYQSKGYDADTDSGIHFDSFGFNWPVSNPIVSQRDLAHPTLSDYTSPF